MEARPDGRRWATINDGASSSRLELVGGEQPTGEQPPTRSGRSGSKVAVAGVVHDVVAALSPAGRAPRGDRRRGSRRPAPAARAATEPRCVPRPRPPPIASERERSSTANASGLGAGQVEPLRRVAGIADHQPAHGPVEGRASAPGQDCTWCAAGERPERAGRAARIVLPRPCGTHLPVDLRHRAVDARTRTAPASSTGRKSIGISSRCNISQSI